VSASSHGSKLSGIPYKDSQSLLRRLSEREGNVQDALQRLGCCDTEGYTQLYTTRLVRKACATPARAASYLAMPKAERLQYICEVGWSALLLYIQHTSPPACLHHAGCAVSCMPACMSMLHMC